MIKILLDECLPKKLIYRIRELDENFFVKTTPDMGWAGLTNGELLAISENEFDVFIASDTNLSFQQTIPSTTLQIILMKAQTNTHDDILPLVKKLQPLIKSHQPGEFIKVE